MRLYSQTTFSSSSYGEGRAKNALCGSKGRYTRCRKGTLIFFLQHEHFPGDHMKIVKHDKTRQGCFYNHSLNALDYLTDCGKNNSIFTGNKSKRVDFSEWSVRGHTIKVYDYFTAVEATEDVIDQGESSSLNNAVAWDTGSKEDLSHYFMFYSVSEKHKIQMVEKTPPRDSDDDIVVGYSKVRCYKIIQSQTRLRVFKS